MPGLAEALKAEGNDAYAAGDNATALGCYERGIALAAGGDEEAAAILHVLHSNASAAAARIDGKAQAAKAHADDAVALKPDWAKGYVRQAGAALLLHRPGDAERALRGGLKACPAVADQAALRQELDRLLQVRGVCMWRWHCQSGRLQGAQLLWQCGLMCVSSFALRARPGFEFPPAAAPGAGRWRPERSARLPAGHPGTEHARLSGAGHGRMLSWAWVLRLPSLQLPLWCRTMQGKLLHAPALPVPCRHASLLPLPCSPAPHGLQSEYGLRMTGPAALAALPCDAFRYAFLGELQKFK